MDYHDGSLRRFEEEILEMARFFQLDDKNLEVEFYTPRTQLIVVERAAPWRFRIHINIQEKRIVSVRQIESTAPAVRPEALSKYKAFMK